MKPASKQTSNDKRSAPSPCAIGFRAHSGWSAMVILGGPLREPVILQRTRITLIDPRIAGSKQPFHHARELDLKAAASHVERCTAKATQLAEESVRAAIRFSLEQGHRVTAAGIILASGRQLPGLESILASHPLLHTAEGQLFRDVLAEAAKRCGLPITGVKERELFAQAEEWLRLRATQIKKRLDAMGDAVGSPWRQDEKYSALVAWMALADVSR